MMYLIIEEASGALVCITDDLQDAIQEAKSRRGKYLVLDEAENILFDSEPGVTYKF